MKLELFIVVMLLLVSPLRAEVKPVSPSPAAGLLESKSDEPTEVIADETEWNRTTNCVVARGNACIKQGESVVKAPEITGYFVENEGQRRLDHTIAKGDVHLTHQDKILTSDEVIAYFAEEEGVRKLVKAVATGNVHITTPTQKAISDKAIYEPHEDVAILEGNVTLTQDQNKMVGDWAKANFTTGNNIIRADKSQGGQVRGLLFPQKKKTKAS